jgi:hypothetical protein
LRVRRLSSGKACEGMESSLPVRPVWIDAGSWQKLTEAMRPRCARMLRAQVEAVAFWPLVHTPVSWRLSCGQLAKRKPLLPGIFPVR